MTVRNLKIEIFDNKRDLKSQLNGSVKIGKIINAVNKGFSILLIFENKARQRPLILKLGPGGPINV